MRRTLLALLIIVAASAAHASEATVVSVPLPYGSWINDVLNVAAPLLKDLAELAATALIGAVPVYLRPIYKQFITAQVVEHAVDSAIARVDGAVKGKTVSPEISNAILAQALHYVEGKEPRIVSWLGAYLVPRIQAQIVKAGMAPAEAMQPPLPPKA